MLGKLGVALGPQDFLDTNILVLAKRKSHVGWITQPEDPMRRVCVPVEYRP